jgi:pyridinium-3,5-bisthiocarboxylic acid mononucleotide nickel chelatase
VIGWLDLASGASGDMLLAALVDAGVPESVIDGAVTAIAVEPIAIQYSTVQRGALRSRRARVEVAESVTTRRLTDVLAIITEADVRTDVRTHATAVFQLLAQAEGAVHGVGADDVHLHEVGALDALADIVGVCAGFSWLALDELHASRVQVGGGSVATSHGTMSVPVPAVARLLEGVPTVGGPADRELCTPTGAALLRHWVTSWGPQPPMRVARTGVGAGAADLPTHANVVRLLVGAADSMSRTPAYTVEANVDDLDPRIWPTVVERLLTAGASDAWLTPIVMKKGRPAHTLSVLVPPERLDAVRGVIVAETSAIGMRQRVVDKYALDRDFVDVSVDGQPVRVKIARAGGQVVNVQPEYDDVLRAARVLGWSVKRTLARAQAAAVSYWG